MPLPASTADRHTGTGECGLNSAAEPASPQYSASRWPARGCSSWDCSTRRIPAPESIPAYGNPNPCTGHCRADGPIQPRIDRIGNGRDPGRISGVPRTRTDDGFGQSRHAVHGIEVEEVLRGLMESAAAEWATGMGERSEERRVGKE